MATLYIVALKKLYVPWGGRKREGRYFVEPRGAAARGGGAKQGVRTSPEEKPCQRDHPAGTWLSMLFTYFPRNDV